MSRKRTENIKTKIGKNVDSFLDSCITQSERILDVIWNGLPPDSEPNQKRFRERKYGKNSNERGAWTLVGIAGLAVLTAISTIAVTRSILWLNRVSSDNTDLQVVSTVTDATSLLSAELAHTVIDLEVPSQAFDYLGNKFETWDDVAEEGGADGWIGDVSNGCENGCWRVLSLTEYGASDSESGALTLEVIVETAADCDTIITSAPNNPRDGGLENAVTVGSATRVRYWSGNLPEDQERPACIRSEQQTLRWKYQSLLSYQLIWSDKRTFPPRVASDLQTTLSRSVAYRLGTNYSNPVFASRANGWFDDHLNDDAVLFTDDEFALSAYTGDWHLPVCAKAGSNTWFQRSANDFYLNNSGGTPLDDIGSEACTNTVPNSCKTNPPGSGCDRFRVLEKPLSVVYYETPEQFGATPTCVSTTGNVAPTHPGLAWLTIPRRTGTELTSSSDSGTPSIGGEALNELRLGGNYAWVDLHNLPPQSDGKVPNLYWSDIPIVVSGTLPPRQSVVVASSGNVYVLAPTTGTGTAEFGSESDENGRGAIGLVSACDVVVIGQHERDTNSNSNTICPNPDPNNLLGTALPTPCDHSIALNRVAVLAPAGILRAYSFGLPNPATSLGVPREMSILGAVAAQHRPVTAVLRDQTAEDVEFGYRKEFSYPSNFAEESLPWWPTLEGGVWQREN